MSFASEIFVFGFLPMFLVCYFAAPKKARNLVIVLASYGFYSWWRLDYLGLLIAVTLWSYWLGKAIKGEVDPRKRRQWLWLGLALNLGTLGYFKYTNFGIATLNALLVEFGAEPLRHSAILLPIGISFFIFQAISYLVDIWRNDAEPAQSLLDLAAFKALFPQLIAGPVLRYKDVSDQFSYRTHTLEKFLAGLKRFTLGLAMKVLLADPLAPLIDRHFALPNPSVVESWAGALAYTAQLFFDFAGYSAMAIGLGLMIGFRFMENFATPYSARSITEFWQRWHISLSTWLRDYLYIPLGGNRGGTILTIRNLVLTMVLGGLWHGANWTFVLWGLWHGLWMAAERLNNRTSLWPIGLRTLGTFLIVVLGWVMFRAPDLETASRLYGGLFGGFGFWPNEANAWMISPNELLSLALAYAVIGLGIFQARQPPLAVGLWFERRAVPATLVILFCLAATKLSASAVTPFLYFQF